MPRAIDPPLAWLTGTAGRRLALAGLALFVLIGALAWIRRPGDFAGVPLLPTGRYVMTSLVTVAALVLLGGLLWLAPRLPQGQGGPGLASRM